MSLSCKFSQLTPPVHLNYNFYFCNIFKSNYCLLLLSSLFSYIAVTQLGELEEPEPGPLKIAHLKRQK